MEPTPPPWERRGWGGPCATSEGYLQGEVAGASRRAHPSAPPPALYASSPTRRRATSLIANGTVVLERPHRHPPPLPLQCRARRLQRAPHTGWPRADAQPPIPASQRHGRGHCPSASAIHHATITVQHLFPLTSDSGALVQLPERWVEATTWWERTDGRPPAHPSLLYAMIFFSWYYVN
jgi:hypothetical protein